MPDVNPDATVDQRHVEQARAAVAANTWAAWVCSVPAREYQRSRGELAGIPFGVKDIIDVAGLATRCGSPLTSSAPASQDADLVARMVSLGAVPVGKTVTTEFAYFAPGPTRNPRDGAHTPGGSSSGSAAAVAAGDVPVALGSQTAGSLIRPAAYCGVTGLVLSAGALSLRGFGGLSPTLDRVGLVTRDVGAMKRLTSALLPSTRTTSSPARRVVVWRGADLAGIHPAMDATLDRANLALRAAGITVEECTVDDHIGTLAGDHGVVMAREVADTRPDLMAWRDQVSSQLRALLDRGTSTAEVDYDGALFRRDRSCVELDTYLGDSAVIIGPAAPGPAPRGLDATGSPILSLPWQLLGYPQITIPAGAHDGLPLGVQLIGPAGSEPLLLASAALLEAALTSHPHAKEQ